MPSTPAGRSTRPADYLAKFLALRDVHDRPHPAIIALGAQTGRMSISTPRCSRSPRRGRPVLPARRTRPRPGERRLRPDRVPGRRRTRRRTHHEGQHPRRDRPARRHRQAACSAKTSPIPNAESPRAPASDVSTAPAPPPWRPMPASRSPWPHGASGLRHRVPRHRPFAARVSRTARDRHPAGAPTPPRPRPLLHRDQLLHLIHRPRHLRPGPVPAGRRRAHGPPLAPRPRRDHRLRAGLDTREVARVMEAVMASDFMGVPITAIATILGERWHK